MHALAADQPDVALPVCRAFAAAARRRSGRPDRHRPCRRADRDRRPRRVAALARRRDRRSRRGGGLSCAFGKFRRRYRAVLDRPHDRTLRPFGADPRKPAGARRSADGDASGAARRSCRRRSPASSPRGNGWGRSMPNSPPGTPAKRRPSRSPPTRLTTKSARWCSICARAVSSPPA